MGTFSDLQNNIANDLTRTDLTSQIQSAVLDAIDFYESARFYFNVTRSMTFQTVVGQVAYQPGTADVLPLIRGIVKIDRLFLPLAPTTIFELTFKEQAEFEWLAGSAPGFGQPMVYTYVDRQIMLWPTPIQVYTIRPHMHFEFPPLVNPGDSNAWTDDGERLIRAQSKLNLYTNVLEDDAGAQRMQNEIPALKSKLDYKTTAKLASGRIKATRF
jgi:hypothetical protein